MAELAVDTVIASGLKKIEIAMNTRDAGGILERKDVRDILKISFSVC